MSSQSDENLVYDRMEHLIQVTRGITSSHPNVPYFASMPNVVTVSIELKDVLDAEQPDAGEGKACEWVCLLVINESS